ncbi:MAG: tetratricopeptide repeat protein [Gammaproteobacteria bacterium]|nr:tetratricopeptide repeat protein [Gammaproteobacteria bacterium]
MTEYLTEQEQIQQLKSWVKQYGLTVVFGILIAVLITSGWQYWQNYRYKILTHASAVYDEMLTMRAQNNAHETVVQANKLITHYPKTPYAVMAALVLSRNAVIDKNYPEAIKQLNWAKDHSKNNSIQEVARIRIARILIAEKQYNEALTTLDTLNDENYLGMVDEVRGDIYMAKQDNVSASKFYQLALKEIPNADISRPILQMKLANVTTNNSAP